MLTCSTNSSLIVDSIELLDSNGERIAAPSRNVSSIQYYINGTTMNATYVCRVNSTLGSQIYQTDNELINNYYAETEETTVVTQSVTLVAEKHSPGLIIPITAASAGALLVLLVIFFIVCIISLR